MSYKDIERGVQESSCEAMNEFNDVDDQTENFIGSPPFRIKLLHTAYRVVCRGKVLMSINRVPVRYDIKPVPWNGVRS